MELGIYPVRNRGLGVDGRKIIRGVGGEGWEVS